MKMRFWERNIQDSWNKIDTFLIEND